MIALRVSVLPEPEPPTVIKWGFFSFLGTQITFSLLVKLLPKYTDISLILI